MDSVTREISSPFLISRTKVRQKKGVPFVEVGVEILKEG